MNASDHALSTRLQQLLQVVEQDRETRCARLIEEARAEAGRILRQSWQKTRARLHHEVLAERERYRRQLLIEQGGSAARQRQVRERADRAWLEQAWQPLQEALTRRWETAESRALWVDALMRLATARLVRGDWQIEHPPDWPSAERQQLAAHLQAALGQAPMFVADPAIAAGIRVRAGATVVDGTCAGLLRDRNHIEALLLAMAKGAANG